MVGNKVDLEKQRNIDFDEAQMFFKQNVKIMPGKPQKELLPMLFESSAKTGFNVNNVFESCVRQVLLKRERDKMKSKKNWRKISSPPPLEKKKKGIFSFFSNISVDLRFSKKK